MTSRLKHKLEIENINLKSAYLNESFVFIGTPLPALAESKKDKLEYVPEWQQEVRDEKGRRRFHGAFTGGWSAGYGNTVGSKEGWAPSTFKSSRNNRASAVQRAEDFMDEEDLQQMNEDRKLENTETFKNDGFAGTREELANRGASALESLIAPAQTSIGQKLLTKLGWRPGQGIGPRVSLRKLRIQEGKLGRLGTEVSGEDLDDAEAGKHTFAPRDTKLLVYEGKGDRQGLGYERGSGMSRMAGSSSRAAAFGAARRPELDEDEDPYAEASGSSQRFIIDQEDDVGDVIMVGGRAGPPSSSDFASTSTSDRWHDGRPILPGFTLDPKGVPPDKWFEMPDIPPDWRPRPARVWGTTRKWDETPGTVKEEKELVRGAPGKPLTFEERGAALGEDQRISKAKSVFEYMSEKDRERLATLAASANVVAPLPLIMDEAEPEVEARPPAEEVEIPPLSPRTASAALKGFIPYGDDPAKQDRYRSYLSSQLLNTTQPDPVLRSGTFDEINKELDDFASSARIFKPMSFAMSSRFTSGSSTLAASDLKQAKPGLHMYDAAKAKAEAEKPKVAEVEIKKKLTPREQAAANGMYGQMTRVVKEFYPVKLLCKRFGVADPHPEGDPGKSKTAETEASGSLDDTPLPSNDASWEDKFIHQESSAQPTESASNEERRPRTIGEVGMADDANQGRETLSYTKPSIDIFKAIFASDDEDDDEEDEVAVVPSKGVNGKEDGLDGEPAKRADPFPVKPEEPVDLAVFKPVFNLKKDDDTSQSKEERKKAKKEKRKRKGVLSFDVGEDADADEPPRQKDEKKRKKSHENGSSAEQKDEAEEWVEKPEIKPRLVGRKGAADYM